MPAMPWPWHRPWPRLWRRWLPRWIDLGNSFFDSCWRLPRKGWRHIWLQTTQHACCSSRTSRGRSQCAPCVAQGGAKAAAPRSIVCKVPGQWGGRLRPSTAEPIRAAEQTPCPQTSFTTGPAIDAPMAQPAEFLCACPALRKRVVSSAPSSWSIRSGRTPRSCCSAR